MRPCQGGSEAVRRISLSSPSFLEWRLTPHQVRTSLHRGLLPLGRSPLGSCFRIGELAISRVLIIPNGTLLAIYSMVALSFAARVRPCGGLS